MSHARKTSALDTSNVSSPVSLSGDDERKALPSFRSVPLPPVGTDEEEEDNFEDDFEDFDDGDDNDINNNNDSARRGNASEQQSEKDRCAVDFSQKLVADMKQSMSAGGYYENANSPTSPSQPVASNLSHILAGGPSSNTFRRQSTKDGGKPRQPQLLHKRMQDMAISQAQANDLILSTNLEEMAINTNIPQWLIYSWTSKAKDKKITDKRTQQCVAELMVLKQYVFPVALCLSLSASHQEIVARNLLTIFQNVHLILDKSTYDSWSKDNRPPIPFRSDSLAKRKDHVISFLEAIIAEEVDEAKSESTLFRSNNIISKLLTLYANLVGKDYLYGILHDVVEKVLVMGNMEVDPAKLEQQGPDAIKDIYANMKRLLSATKLVLSSVVSSMSKCPIGLKKLAYIIQRQVENKFRSKAGSPVSPQDPNMSSKSLTFVDGASPISTNTSRHVAVSGFIFLRFICPAIVSPDSYGIVNHPLNATQRRTLILISKVLQNLANGVKFGSKESYMTPANVFLEENESLVRGYCESLQSMEQENVYWINDAMDIASLDGANFRARIVELEQSFEQIMSAFNTCMGKIMDKIADVQVSEVMTYTVFGALKSMIKRFEHIERIYDIAFGEGSTEKHRGSIYALSQRDTELMNNFVLLGGLEEILLMNDCVLLRAMIMPSNFVPGKPFYMSAGFGNHNSQPGVHRELDVLARSAVHILSPHGSLKLVEFVEWTLLQEIRLRSTVAPGQKKPPSGEILKKILAGPSNEDAKSNPYQLSISFRLIVSFFLVHVRDLLKTGISQELQDIWDSTSNFEIDPSKLSADENVKANLDNLINAAMKLFNAIVGSAKNAPPAFKRLIRYIFFHLTENASDTGKDYEKSLAILSNFLFVYVICPAVATPIFYGVLPDNTRASISAATPVTSETHPCRTFTLISYIMRFLSNKSVATYIEGNPVDSQEESILYEKEIIGSLVEQWNKSSIHMVQGLIQVPHGQPGTMSPHGSFSTLSKSSDPPIPVSSAARAKALLYIRKMLGPSSVKHLKGIVDTQKFKDATRNMTLKDLKKSDKSTDSSHSRKEDLSGLRVETIQYKLMDRVRIVFSNIYKEPESLSLLREIQARQKSIQHGVSHDNKLVSGEVHDGLGDSKQTPGTERGRAAGFVVLNNKARKGMASTSHSFDARAKSEHAEMAALVKEKEVSATTSASKLPNNSSRWNLVSTPANVALATKNLIKGIFAHATKSHQVAPHDDVLEENMFLDDVDEKKEQATTSKDSDNRNTSESSEDISRSLIGVMRQRNLSQQSSISAAVSADKKRAKIRFQEAPEYSATNPVEKKAVAEKDESDNSDIEDSGILNFELDEDKEEKSGSPAVKSKRLKRRKGKDGSTSEAPAASVGRKGEEFGK